MKDLKKQLNGTKKMNSTKLREEIFERIIKYYNLEHTDKEFIPGKSKIHFAGRVYDEKEMLALTDSILDFWLTTGRFTVKFEENFSKLLNVKHTIVTNSGSSANLLAVSSLKLKPNSEVITPAATFPTTFNPIIQNNLTPILIDSDLETLNINPTELKKAISKKTKLIMLPHTLGNPNDMDYIMDFAKDNQLQVIEDTCDALGSKYNGKMLGTFGDIGTFSFYAAHHITMGEGGALCTNNEELSSTIRSFRDWGRACVCPICKQEEDPDYNCPLRFAIKSNNLPNDYDKRYTYTNIGYNLKITDMQAAIGFVQLKKLHSFTKAREKNFKILYKEISRYEDYLILPKSIPKAEPSWFTFPLTVKKNNKFKREDIIKWLEKHNIETRLLFAGNIINQPAYKNIKYKKIGNLKNTNYIMNNTFFIGNYPGLTDEMLNFIINRFKKFFSSI